MIESTVDLCAIDPVVVWCQCSSNDSASSSCSMFRYALNPGSYRFIGLRFSILDGSLSGLSIHIVWMSLHI